MQQSGDHRETTRCIKWTTIARALATMAIPATLVLTPAADVRATGDCNGPAPTDYLDPLQYGGGPVLTLPWIVGVFWGPLWQFEPTFISDDLGAFLGDLPAASGYVNVLTQYGMAPYLTTLGTRFVTEPGGLLTDQQLQASLAAMVNNGTIPQAPNGQTLVVIFLDEATSINDPGFHVCTPTGPDQVGYHRVIDPSLTNANITYAVVGSLTDSCIASMVAPVPRVLQGRAQRDRRTIIASHEIAEAITDPMFGNETQQGWYFHAPGTNDPDEEIGDVCEDPSNAVQITVSGTDTWWGCRSTICTAPSRRRAGPPARRPSRLR
jgi:hypothetical protein